MGLAGLLLKRVLIEQSLVCVYYCVCAHSEVSEDYVSDSGLFWHDLHLQIVHL